MVPLSALSPWRSTAALAGRLALASEVHLTRRSERNFSWDPAQLPKLPVPPLQQTLTKFLELVKPITNADQFRVTEQLVREFAKPGGDGERLHKFLEDRAKAKDNWLTDWWLAKGYMEQRIPVPINVSPGIHFPLQEFTCPEDQIEYAAKVIRCMLQVKESIDEQSLPVDKAGGQPLDMSQYGKLFGTCRIPGEPSDHLRFEDPKHRGGHVVVACANQFFSLPVLDPTTRQPYSVSSLVRALTQIVAEARAAPAQPGVGILTTENRTVWAQARDMLRKDPANDSVFEAMESSLFLVCIDEPSTKHADKLTRMSHQMVHGGGSDENSANRWFDKTLQFVIGADGSCGITYEHSPAEGPAVAAMVDFVATKLNETLPSLDAAPEVTPLKFAVDSDVQRVIDAACNNFDNAIKQLDLAYGRFTGFGKNYAKSQKLSPDSFFQVALQVAFRRLHKKPAPTYETGTLRAFRFGRTDTIRLPNAATEAFALSMLNDPPSAKQAALLRKAVEAHRNYTVLACAGNGIDRHLLGLRLSAEELGEPVPPLFKGDAYQTSLHFLLSTSQVPTKAESCMMFGPMYSDGYGCCYNPQKDSINFAVSASTLDTETNARSFVDSVYDSLEDMRTVLDSAPKSKL